MVQSEHFKEHMYYRQGNERKHESRDPISFTEKGLLNKYHIEVHPLLPQSPGTHRTQSLFAEFLILDFVKET